MLSEDLRSAADLLKLINKIQGHDPMSGNPPQVVIGAGKLAKLIKAMEVAAKIIDDMERHDRLEHYISEFGTLDNIVDFSALKEEKNDVE